MTKDKDGETHVLSSVHRPIELAEQERLAKTYVIDNNGVQKFVELEHAGFFCLCFKSPLRLTVSRGIADQILGNDGEVENFGCIPVPEVVKFPLNYCQGDVVVIGTDGLWDAMGSGMVADYVISSLQKNGRNVAATVDDLVAEAIRIRNSDNITAMIIDLQRYKDLRGS